MWPERPGRTGPYALFPPLPYLQWACQVWLSYPVTVWPKARQMAITWLFASLYLGDALFLGGRLNLIQSRDQVASTHVLRRMRGVYERMRGMAPWLVPDLRKSNESMLEFVNGSVLLSVPQGAHYFQSYTPSGGLFDEAQLQDEIAKAVEYAGACCERITLVGSADYGWLYQVVLQDLVGQQETSP